MKRPQNKQDLSFFPGNGILFGRKQETGKTGVFCYMEETDMAKQDARCIPPAEDSQYVKMAKIFKAMSDPKRVKIMDLLA